MTYCKDLKEISSCWTVFLGGWWPICGSGREDYQKWKHCKDEGREVPAFDLLLRPLLPLEWMNGSQKGKVRESCRNSLKFCCKFVTAYSQEQLEYALETLFLESLAARLAPPPGFPAMCVSVCVCSWFPWKRMGFKGRAPQDQPKFSPK